MSSYRIIDRSSLQNKMTQPLSTKAKLLLVHLLCETGCGNLFQSSPRAIKRSTGLNTREVSAAFRELLRQGLVSQERVSSKPAQHQPRSYC